MSEHTPEFDARVRNALGGLDPTGGHDAPPSSLSSVRHRADSLERRTRARRTVGAGVAASLCLAVVIGVMLRSRETGLNVIDPATTAAPATTPGGSGPSQVPPPGNGSVPPGTVVERRRHVLPDGFVADSVVASGDTLWVGGGFDASVAGVDHQIGVLRIDRETGAVEGRYDTDNWVADLVVLDGRAYAVTVPPDGEGVPPEQADPRLFELDPGSDAATALPIPEALITSAITEHAAIEAAGGALYLVSALDGIASRYDPGTRAVVWQVALTPGVQYGWSPSVAVQRDGTAYVGQGTQVFTIDPSGAVVASTPRVEGRRQEVQVAGNGAAIWVSTDTGDTVDGVALGVMATGEALPLDGGALISAPVESGLVAMDEGVWVALRASTGEVYTRFVSASTFEPVGQLVSGRVADAHDGALWTIEGARAGTVVEWDTTALLTRPTTMTTHDDAVSVDR